MKDQKYYENLGWKFDEEVWYDGHNNDRNVSYTFKSPRMKSFQHYSSSEKLEDIEHREAFLMAWDTKNDFELRNLIPNALIEYYLKNPNKTGIPKIKVTIDEL